MNWKFWEKAPKQGNPSVTQTEKLPKPKPIPESVGRYLVVNLGKNPDWVWNLKGAVRPRNDKKNAYDVRVFDEATAKANKVSVKDYTSLDQYPDLILFEGWFDKRSCEVQGKDKGKPRL